MKQFLDEELATLQELASAGNAQAQAVLNWVEQSGGAGEAFYTLPGSVDDLKSLLEEVSRTAELFFLARLINETRDGEIPSTFRLKISTTFDDL